MKKILVSVVLAVLTLAAIAAAPLNEEFDSGTVALTNASAYEYVTTIRADGRPVVMDVQVGAAGALAHFMVAQAARADATTRPLATDTDFAMPTVAVPYVLTTQPVQTCTGGSGFQLRLDSGAAEYQIRAQRGPTTNTTIRVSGRVL